MDSKDKEEEERVKACVRDCGCASRREACESETPRELSRKDLLSARALDVNSQYSSNANSQN